MVIGLSGVSGMHAQSHAALVSKSVKGPAPIQAQNLVVWIVLVQTQQSRTATPKTVQCRECGQSGACGQAALRHVDLEKGPRQGRAAIQHLPMVGLTATEMIAYQKIATTLNAQVRQRMLHMC